MPNIDVCGLVTREVKYGENSRILTVLAKDIGKVSVLASRARTNRSGLLTATQLFAYSNFTLFKGRENSLMKMNEGEVIESFSEIRNSLDNMAYASYFCDIANHICTDGTEENELLGLLLRVLKRLSVKEENTAESLKAECVFLFRALSIAGFAPNCDGCASCGKNENIKFYNQNGINLIGGSGAIDSTSLEKGTMLSIGTVYAEKNQGIGIRLNITPSDKSVQYGIITSDNKKRFVYGTGSCYHVFSISDSGNYEIFIKNTSSKTVTIEGGYSVY